MYFNKWFKLHFYTSNYSNEIIKMNNLITSRHLFTSGKAYRNRDEHREKLQAFFPQSRKNKAVDIISFNPFKCF